ncbi:MAG TPA: FAD-dependent monooxygenase [Bacteroidota bacterium]|nr:FAD-dependent monooxygenase [Bacteroidota bacterium]
MRPDGASHYDVVVVGAGPAGSSCASTLARNGSRVLLVDKAAFPREKVCGDCINPLAWESFRSLGVHTEIVNRSREIERVVLCGPSGRGLTLQVSHIRGPQSAPSYPFVSIDRKDLDHVLLKRARAIGVEVRERTELAGVNALSITPEKWAVRLTVSGSAEAVTVTCRFLVAADGRNSRLARLIGSPRRKNSFSALRGLQRVGIRLAVRHEGGPIGQLTMFFFEGGYGGIVDLTPSTANIAVVTTPSLAQLISKDPDRFILLTLHGNPGAREYYPHLLPLGDPFAIAPIESRELVASSSHAYLVGDARRTIEPFSGAGVTFALEDGISTALEISSRLRGSSWRKPRIRTRFSVSDRILSPVLRSGRLVTPLLGLGAIAPFAARLIAKSFLPYPSEVLARHPA